VDAVGSPISLKKRTTDKFVQLGANRLASRRFGTKSGNGALFKATGGLFADRGQAQIQFVY
jgi:hypothetical protein